MRKAIVILLGLTMCLSPIRADFELPGDMATIEALISFIR